MPDPAEDVSRAYSGRWLLWDTYPRGGITADVYDLRADGTLDILLQHDPAGIIYQCSGEDTRRCRGGEVPTCKFGDRWRMFERADSLYWEVSGYCSDGLMRDIVFLLKEDEINGAAGYRLYTKDVNGGESGWHLVGFDGTLDSSYLLVRCEDAEPWFCMGL